MKKLISLLSVSSLLLVACGEEETSETEPAVEETEVAEVEAEDVEDEGTQEPEEESTSEYGKRSNPVPLGEWIEIEDTYYDADNSQIDSLLNVRVTDVVRGEEAFNILMEENQFNEPAPEGYEWVIATLEAELLEGSEDEAYTLVPWINVMDSTGSEVSQDEYGTLSDNEYGYVDLFPGGSTSGRISFYTLEEDDSLLAYEHLFDSTTYFSLK